MVDPVKNRPTPAAFNKAADMELKILKKELEKLRNPSIGKKVKDEFDLMKIGAPTKQQAREATKKAIEEKKLEVNKTAQYIGKAKKKYKEIYDKGDFKILVKDPKNFRLRSNQMILDLGGYYESMDKKSQGGLVDYRKGGMVTKTVNNLKNKK